MTGSSPDVAFDRATVLASGWTTNIPPGSRLAEFAAELAVEFRDLYGMDEELARHAGEQAAYISSTGHGHFRAINRVLTMMNWQKPPDSPAWLDPINTDWFAPMGTDYVDRND